MKRVLVQMGMDPKRVKLIWTSAAEGAIFTAEINRFVEEVRALGPLNWNATNHSNRRNHSRGGDSMSKPKFAMYWAASCGGCEIAVLNIHEKILDVDANFEVVFWPVAMDAKYKDVEAMEDGSILLTLFNGGIRNDENEHIAKLMRRKSQILVAFGSCANEGCIPGLANFSPSSEIMTTAFNTITTDNPQGILPQTTYAMPEGEIHIPTILPRLKTLAQVVDVDYFMPGCPPESHQIAAVIDLVDPGPAGQGGITAQGSGHRGWEFDSVR